MELPWYRHDTSAYSHDKILELVETYGTKGKAAGFVYDNALGHAVGHATDGVVRKTSLRSVHGTPGDAALLVAVGLWEVVDGGWHIVNFGTRQVVGAASQVAHDQKSKAGSKGAEKRWGGDEQ
jgi:hypothetical protein